MGRLRAVFILVSFLILTFFLIPIQFLFLRVFPLGSRKLPQWYHARVCKLLGLRIRIEGSIKTCSSILFVSNHTSWLDIPLLSVIAPVSFVAKDEVGSWPLISLLAKLQRTIFINRTRRSLSRKYADEILARISKGDAIVLFGEGTSTDGNRVLNFKSSLFAAVMPSKTTASLPKGSIVQTVSLVYTHLHGVPLGWADRSFVGWYGNMEFMSHAWELLKKGPLDVKISIGPPVTLNSFMNRKELADHTEQIIQKEVVRLLRGYSPDKIFQTTKASKILRNTLSIKASSEKWR